MAFWTKGVYITSNLTEIFPEKEYSVSINISWMKTQKQFRKTQQATKKEAWCSLVLFESEQTYFLFTFGVLCLSHSLLDRNNILLLPEMLHFTDLQGRDWVCYIDWSLSKYFDVGFQKNKDLQWENILESIHYYSISIDPWNHRTKEAGGSLWRFPSPNPSSHSEGNSNRWLRVVSTQFWITQEWRLHNLSRWHFQAFGSPNSKKKKKLDI